MASNSAEAKDAAQDSGGPGGNAAAAAPGQQTLTGKQEHCLFGPLINESIGNLGSG
jgi:hypothetical protein